MQRKDSYDEFLILDDDENYREDGDYVYDNADGNEENDKYYNEEDYFDEDQFNVETYEEDIPEYSEKRDEENYEFERKDSNNNFRSKDYIQDLVFEEKEAYTFGRKNELANKNFVSERSKKLIRVKESSENLKKISEDQFQNKNQASSVLQFLESSKSSNSSYWNVFDRSFQGVLEYGVVIEIKGGNQYLIASPYGKIIGVTLKGFKLHNSKIILGDIIVYCMIDSNFNFQISKVYISAKATQNEINILYRRGELSPSLYQLHLSMKKNHSSIFHSNATSSTSSSSSNTKLPGNQLQDFVYQEKTLAAFTNHQHNNSSSTHSQLSEEFDILHHHSPPVPSPLSPTISQQNHKINPAVITTSFAKLQEKERILSQLKEMLHFNRMILLKVLDYFGNYIEKQPQLKAMIVKMGTRSFSSSSALNLQQQQQQQQQQLPIQESLSDQENDSSQNTPQNTSEKKKKFKLKKKSKKFDNSFYPDREDTSINTNNTNNTKKIEKKKSKVGILFYLFFLETIHQLISHLSSSSSSPQQQHQIQHQQIQQQRYNYHPHPTKFTYQEEKIHEIIDICLFSYNINNHFGKLFRFLFQQAFTFLCEHHQEFLQLQNLCENDEIDSNNNDDDNDEEEDNDNKDDENNDTTQKTTLSEEMKRYRRYKRVINEVTHMDIILNILPFLQFEDIFQCCFLFFPSKVMSFIDHHPHPQSTPTTTTTSSSISPGKLSAGGQTMGKNPSTSSSSSSLAQSSLFKNLEDVKQLIKYLFHEINQNKDYFHIANDIYDIFSYHINWDKFIKQMN